MKRLCYLGLLLLGMIMVLSCSKKEERSGASQLKPPDPTTGIREADFVWSKEVGPDVTFYYQPTDSLKKIATLLKNRVVTVYHSIDTMLCFHQLEPIEYYCYDSPEALKQYTGRDGAFSLGNRFYYGFGPVFGGEIAEYLIGKLPGGPTRFAFIRDGLPLLLDHSGRNYHHATNNFLQEKSLLGVQLLIDDKAFEKEQGMQKSVEAASLCAYIMYQYGYEKFMQLYHNQNDFPTALKQVLGIDTKTLAKDWETFLPEHTNEKEQERETAAAAKGRT
ncbi:MAG: hypothetical protein E4G91_03940 [Candidatus Zixiibacteriota bacterium]|nr:MAG: hypothetical protein E4G91_03940 [candidate division Zixibacteria bacterium]